MLRVMGMLLLLSVLPLHAADEPVLPQLKEYHLTTALVAAGQPAAIIVSAQHDGYDALAQKLQEAIQQASGVELGIVRDTDVGEADYGRTHMILLGNLMTNRVAARLYCQEYLNTDAGWPGKPGDLLETVHNPLGLGHNFIACGGSDTAGVAAAVETLIAKIKPGRDIVLGPLYELETVQKSPAPLSEQAANKIVDGVKARGYRTIGSQLTSIGSTMLKWRTPGYGFCFRMLIDAQWAEMDKLKVCDDMRTMKFLPSIWDMIEESPQFSDEDRRHISDFMYQHAHKTTLAHTKVKPSAQPHGNNWNATASFCAALYFHKYYPELEISRRLIERADTWYRGDIAFWKVAEDCPGYGDITARANLHYALRRPDMSYFDSGNARRLADYDVVVTTNRGNVAGFGDVSGLSRNYAVNALPIAAWCYRDGGYLWWYKKIGGGPERYWVDDLEEAPPTRFLGVHVLPLDQWIYQRGERAMPIERCFDKISYRHSFEPDDQYLLLGGFSNGFHSHPDGNAIITFTDNNRTLLFDDGYMVPEMSEHNTVLVFKDGLSRPLPSLIRLDAPADFPELAVTSSTAADYNGVDWTRHIVWAKQRYFLVLEELVAKESADFGFQCVWRTLGDVRLDGPRMIANQETTQMHLIEAQGVTQGLKECHPKHPFGTKLLQTAARPMQTGDRFILASLFYAKDAAEAHHVEAERAADGVVSIRDDDAVSVAGLVGLELPGGGRVTADVFWVSADRARLIGGRELAWDGLLFASPAPLDIDLDLSGGQGIVQASATTEIQVQGREIVVAAGRQEISFSAVPDAQIASRRVALTTAHTRLVDARQATTRQAGADAWNMTRLWQYADFDAEESEDDFLLHSLAVADLDNDGHDEIIVGAADQYVYALDETGKRLWKSPVGGRIYELAAADINGDGKGEVAVGCNDKKLYLFDDAGNTVWDLDPPARTYERPNYRGVAPFQGAIKKVHVSDLDGDGKSEIAIGSANWRCYVYSHDGQLLYDECNWAHQPTCLDTFDLDGDGYREVLLGNDYSSFHIYNARDGRIVHSVGTTGHAGPSSLDADDLDGDGIGDIVVGDRGGKIMLLIPWNTKTPQTLQVGVPITKVLIADLDGDGRKESLASAQNGYVYCFESTGQRRWLKNLGEIPHDLACGDLNGDGRAEIVIGGEDNLVHVWSGAGEPLARFPASRLIRHVRLARLPAGPAIIAASDDGTVYALAFRERP